MILAEIKTRLKQFGVHYNIQSVLEVLRRPEVSA